MKRDLVSLHDLTRQEVADITALGAMVKANPEAYRETLAGKTLGTCVVLGTTLILLGCLFWLGSLSATIKGVICILFILITSATAAHALAIAAYNGGKGRVAKALRRTGTDNFWDLAALGRRALPRETREFVPKILAAMLIGVAGVIWIHAQNISNRKKTERAEMLGTGLGIGTLIVITPFWLAGAARVGAERRGARDKEK